MRDDHRSSAEAASIMPRSRLSRSGRLHPEAGGARSSFRFSLRARLLVAVSSVIIAIYAAITLPLYFLIRLNVARDLDVQLREQAVILEFLSQTAAVALQEQVTRLPATLFTFQWYDTNGVILGKSGPLGGTVPLSRTALELAKSGGGTILETVRTSGNPRVRVLTTSLGPRETAQGKPGLLQVACSLEDKGVRIRAAFWWFVAGGCLLVGLSNASVLVVLNQWRRQFDHLCHSARSVELTGHSPQRLVAPAADAELAQIVDAFNALLDRVEKAYATQQQFVADASHEIRTPLTILRGEIDVILRRERNAMEYREVLQSSKEELERLSRLVDNMLMLAWVDTQQPMTAKRKVDLVVVAERVCQRLRQLALEGHVDLELRIKEPCSVSGDATALERAIANLVENAIHFSPKGETVTLLVQSRGTEAQVSVTDHGAGIAAAHLERIFDRFYRIDGPPSQPHRGAGLGLPIVKSIVEQHGGRVDVESVVGTGATFTIRIPQA